MMETLLVGRPPSGKTLYEFNPNPGLNFHQPVAIIDFSGRRTEFRYDSYGNINKVIDPEGHITSITYKAFYRLDFCENRLEAVQGLTMSMMSKEIKLKS